MTHIPSSVTLTSLIDMHGLRNSFHFVLESWLLTDNNGTGQHRKDQFFVPLVGLVQKNAFWAGQCLLGWHGLASHERVQSGAGYISNMLDVFFSNIFVGVFM